MPLVSGENYKEAQSILPTIPSTVQGTHRRETTKFKFYKVHTIVKLQN